MIWIGKGVTEFDPAAVSWEGEDYQRCVSAHSRLFWEDLSYGDRFPLGDSLGSAMVNDNKVKAAVGKVCLEYLAPASMPLLRTGTFHMVVEFPDVLGLPKRLCQLVLKDF